MHGKQVATYRGALGGNTINFEMEHFLQAVFEGLPWGRHRSSPRCPQTHGSWRFSTCKRKYKQGLHETKWCDLRWPCAIGKNNSGHKPAESKQLDSFHQQLHLSDGEGPPLTSLPKVPLHWPGKNWNNGQRIWVCSPIGDDRLAHFWLDL